MSRSIQCRGLTASSLFKYLFIGGFFSLGLFILACAVAAGFGYHTVIFNEVPVVGVKGFLLGLAFMPLFSLIFAVVNWILLGIGMWIWTRLSHIELHYNS